MKLVSVWLLGVTMLFLPGCALIGGGSALDSYREMRAENKSGCAEFSSSGTPPASRVDVKALAVWGEDATIEKCAEYLKGVK